VTPVAVPFVRLRWGLGWSPIGLLRSKRQTHEFSFLVLFDPGADPELGTTEHGVSGVMGMTISLSDLFLNRAPGFCASLVTVLL
jgi:hypothetical protein